MHTVDILEEALELAARSGLSIRKEWLGDARTNLCRIGEQWTIFLNLSQSTNEQLTQILEILIESPTDIDSSKPISKSLRNRLTELLNK